MSDEAFICVEQLSVEDFSQENAKGSCLCTDTKLSIPLLVKLTDISFIGLFLFVFVIV